jgi:hypothetical protein
VSAHSAGAISEQYSQIARLSHTRSPLCSRNGTRPLGEADFTAGESPPSMRSATTSTFSPASRTASQPRMDQEEYRRDPISNRPSGIVESLC